MRYAFISFRVFFFLLFVLGWMCVLDFFLFLFLFHPDLFVLCRVFLHPFIVILKYILYLEELSDVSLTPRIFFFSGKLFFLYLLVGKSDFF